MNIVWSWLTELVELPMPLTAAEGAAKLTSVGLEVEQVTQLGTGFEGAVIAEVLAVRPHPDADKLRIVTVRGDKGGDGIDFGMGIERMAMLRHDVRDIKWYYEPDMRFLKQF